MEETLRQLGVQAPLDTETLLLVIGEIGGDVLYGSGTRPIVRNGGDRFVLEIPREPEGFEGSRAWTNHYLLMGLLDALVRHGYRTDMRRWETGAPKSGIINLWGWYSRLSMPEAMFRERFGALEQMSDYFGVPVTDIEARAVQLGLRQSRYRRY